MVFRQHQQHQQHQEHPSQMQNQYVSNQMPPHQREAPPPYPSGSQRFSNPSQPGPRHQLMPQQQPMGHQSHSHSQPGHHMSLPVAPPAVRPNQQPPVVSTGNMRPLQAGERRDQEYQTPHVNQQPAHMVS